MRTMIRSGLRSTVAGATVLALAAIVAFSAALLAEAKEAAPPSPEARAKAVVVALDAALSGSSPATAFSAVGDTDHRLVADRILAIALAEKTAEDVRVAAFEALRKQKASAEPVAQKSARWLRKHADAELAAFRKGEIGVPMDTKTGEPVSAGRAYDEAVAASAEKARTFAACLRLLGGSPAPREAAELVRPFLQSPHDELVTEALAAITAWKLTEALPDVSFLFRMYPRENRWETGAIVHLGGTNASAKAEWMRYFGHPLKQKARPAVYRSLLSTLEALLGRKVTQPADLDAAPASDGRRKSR